MQSGPRGVTRQLVTPWPYDIVQESRPREDADQRDRRSARLERSHDPVGQEEPGLAPDRARFPERSGSLHSTGSLHKRLPWDAPFVPNLSIEFTPAAIDSSTVSRLVQEAFGRVPGLPANYVTVVFSGHFGRSVDLRQRGGSRPYRSDHRGAGITVAKTIPRPDGTGSDVIVNLEVLSQDLAQVKLGAVTGDLRRFLCHELLHALVQYRDEFFNAAVKPNPVQQIAWHAIDEHRVERALSSHWPQDIDYVGSYLVNLVDFVAGLEDPQVDSAEVIGTDLKTLCEAFAYSLASPGTSDARQCAQRLPRLAGSPSPHITYPPDLVRALLEVPDAQTPVRPELLQLYATSTYDGILGWLRSMGCPLVVDGNRFILAGGGN